MGGVDDAVLRRNGMVLETVGRARSKHAVGNAAWGICDLQPETAEEKTGVFQFLISMTT